MDSIQRSPYKHIFAIALAGSGSFLNLLPSELGGHLANFSAASILRTLYGLVEEKVFRSFTTCAEFHSTDDVFRWLNLWYNLNMPTTFLHPTDNHNRISEQEYSKTTTHVTVLSRQAFEAHR